MSGKKNNDPSENPTEIQKPFVYGSVSIWQGKKAVPELAHKWYVYVRGVKNEDLSPLIKKVQFTLHPSFKSPVRS